MKKRNALNYIVPATFVFVGLPLLLWATGDFPRRTPLKEFLSVLTLVAFCLMLGQFLLARIYGGAVRTLGPVGVVRYHKIIGYTFVAVLLAHPFLIVLPRYFEPGIDPQAAFFSLIKEFDNPGVLLGMTAWGLMVILGVTSLVRGRLPMRPKTWKIFHGVLSGLFVSLGTCHALELGRHTNAAVSAMLIILTVGALALLLRSYFLKPLMKEEFNE